MTVIELGNSLLRLRFIPEVGGSVTDLSVRRGGDWVALMRRGPEPLPRSSDGASFTLAPYSNRLRNGAFAFEGKAYQLRHAEKHASHGDVRDRPWQLAKQTARDALLTFDSRAFPDVNFPFPFGAQVHYVLEDNRLHTQLTITNTGSTRMPAGGGFHPYFNRALGGQDENVELEVAVGGVYPTGDLPLPSGPMIAVPPEQDFSRLRPLDVTLDHCFGGWNGRAVMHWPKSRTRLLMEATASMRHVIIYSPHGQPFFALEPVINVNDGFNLMARGQRDTGVVVLEPGDKVAAAFTLTFEA